MARPRVEVAPDRRREHEWDDGVFQRTYVDKPHFFRADEVGTTVEMGENGYGRSGPTYSRPGVGSQPLLVAGGIILLVIAAVPAVVTLIVLWSLVQATVAQAFRRR